MGCYRHAPEAGGCQLADVTGLAKPVLAPGVWQALLSSRRVLVIHTRAERYYPRDEDIDEIVKARKKRDHALLGELQRILMGEEGRTR